MLILSHVLVDVAVAGVVVLVVFIGVAVTVL